MARLAHTTFLEDIMRRILTAAFALTLAAGLASGAVAQKIDANGKCHDAKGKFAKMEVCKGAATTSPAKAATDPKAPYKLDAKGNCHDAKGKMAKKTMCKAA